MPERGGSSGRGRGNGRNARGRGRRRGRRGDGDFAASSASSSSPSTPRRRGGDGRGRGRGRGRSSRGSRPPARDTSLFGTSTSTSAAGDDAISRLVRSLDEGRNPSPNQQCKRLDKLRHELASRSQEDLLLNGVSLVKRLLSFVRSHTRELRVRMAAGKCLGVLVAATAPEAPAQTFFDEVHATLQQDKPTLQGQVPLLFALGWTLTQDSEHDRFTLHPFIENTLVDLKHLLDKLPSHDDLSPILQSLSLVAQGYPHTFGTHFADIADMSVGWLTEPTLPAKTVALLTRYLEGLRVLWSTNLTTTIHLLQVLLEDAQHAASALANDRPADVSSHRERVVPADSSDAAGARPDEEQQEQQQERAQEPEQEVDVAQVHLDLLCRLRCIAAVVCGLGHDATRGLPSHLRTTLFDNFVGPLHVAVDTAPIPHDAMLYLNKALALLVHTLDTTTSEQLQGVATLLLASLKTDAPSSTDIITTCSDLQALFSAHGTLVSNAAIDAVLGAASPLPPLRFHANSEVVESIMAVYRHCLMLEEEQSLHACSHVVADLHLARGVLCAACGSGAIAHDSGAAVPPQGSPQPASAAPRSASAQGMPPPSSLRVNHALTAAVFDALALIALVQQKHRQLTHTTVQWLVHVIVDKLAVADPKVSRAFPEAAYALLQALYALSKSKRHFVDSVGRDQDSGGASTSLLARVVSCVCACLASGTHLPAEHTVMCLYWLSQICAQARRVQQQNPDTPGSAVWLRATTRMARVLPPLRTLCTNLDRRMRHACVALVHALITSELIHPDEAGPFVAVVLPRMHDTDARVRIAARSVVCDLPVGLAASLALLPSSSSSPTTAAATPEASDSSGSSASAHTSVSPSSSFTAPPSAVDAALLSVARRSLTHALLSSASASIWVSQGNNLVALLAGVLAAAGVTLPPVLSKEGRGEHASTTQPRKQANGSRCDHDGAGDADAGWGDKGTLAFDEGQEAGLLGLFRALALHQLQRDGYCVGATGPARSAGTNGGALHGHSVGAAESGVKSSTAASVTAGARSDEAMPHGKGSSSSNSHTWVSAAGLSRSLMEYWALLSVAVYTVHTRLNTSLGRGWKALEPLEIAVKEMAQKTLQHDHALAQRAVHVWNQLASSPAAPSGTTMGTAALSTLQEDAGSMSGAGVCRRHAGMQRLVAVLDAIERQLRHACGGCTLLPPVPVDTRLFFKTRQHDPGAWLNRLRAHVLVASSTSVTVSAAAWHGLERLAQLLQGFPRVSAEARPKHATQLEMTMQYVATAAVQLRLPHLISGVRAWLQASTPEPYSSDVRLRKWMPWLLACMHEAAGRVDDALQEYDRVALESWVVLLQRAGITPSSLSSLSGLQTLGLDAGAPSRVVERVDSGAMAFVLQRLLRLAAAVGDWERWNAWKQASDGLVHEIRALVSSAQQPPDASASPVAADAAAERIAELAAAKLASQVLPGFAVSLMRSTRDSDLAEALCAFDNSQAAGAHAALGLGDSTACSSVFRVGADWTLQEQLRVCERELFSTLACDLGHIPHSRIQRLQEVQAFLRHTVALSAADNAATTEDVAMLASCVTSTLHAVQPPEGTLASASPGPSSLHVFTAQSRQPVTSPCLAGWIRHLRVASRLSSALPHRVPRHSVDTLRLQVVCLARKTGNLRLAARILNQGLDPSAASLDVAYESSKLLHAQGLCVDGMQRLWGVIVSAMEWLQRPQIDARQSGQYLATHPMLHLSDVGKGPLPCRALLRLARCCQHKREHATITSAITIDMAQQLLAWCDAEAASDGARGVRLGRHAHFPGQQQKLQHQELEEEIRQWYGAGVFPVRHDVRAMVTPSPSTSSSSCGAEEGGHTYPLFAGRAIHLALQLQPRYAKARAAFADWCYVQSSQTLEHTPTPSTPSNNTGRVSSSGTAPASGAKDVRVLLTSSEQQEAAALVQAHLHYLRQYAPGAVVGDDPTPAVLGVLGSSHVRDDVVSGGEEDTARDVLLAGVRAGLQTVIPKAPDALLKALLDLWQKVHTRVTHLYMTAATSYFQYLQLQAEPDPGAGLDEQNARRCDDDVTLTATLRLLRLLSRFWVDLQPVLKEGFACTPTQPWQAVVPQLFSRLGSPARFVQRTLTDLLCRIGKAAPHLVLYAAVVDAASSSVTSAPPRPTAEAAAKGAVGDGGPARTDNGPYAVIRTSLLEHSRTAVRELEGMIAELQRITVLWEEQWLQMLNHQQGRVARCVRELHNIHTRLAANEDLSADEKEQLLAKNHRLTVLPVVQAMDKLWQQTCGRGPETTHERRFAQRLGPKIQHAMDLLRAPGMSFSEYSAEKACQPFKDVLATMRKVVHRKSPLHLQDISPVLAGKTGTSIALPGLSHSAQGSAVVRIERFHGRVTVLPTKTRPKKLHILGTDGSTYTYLFKGMEDLHLDERMMQFLDVVNMIFRNTAPKVNSAAQLHCRNYHVTPLGRRSGLIQWVSGARPVYDLYKHWQQRSYALAYRQYQRQVAAWQQQQQQQQQQQGLRQRHKDGPPKPDAPPAPQTPMARFFVKLTPLLRKHGLQEADLSRRTRWPTEALCAAFHELARETPGDLISTELLLASSNSAEWLHMTQRYICSLAVMSMVGYIIGLGDRHLDNILLDEVTGEVVHIDYNVCFDKGLKLRVPEKVPFRLTRNFLRALGPDAKESGFRQSCERALRLLHDHREILLTLLEAFVYDPLVDWTKDVEGAAEQKALERSISHNLLAARITELRAQLQDACSRFATAAARFQPVFEKTATCFSSLNSAVENVTQLLEEYRLLQQAQQKSGTLQALLPLYEKEDAHQKKVVECRANIKQWFEDCQRWPKQHRAALNKIRSQEMAAAFDDVLDNRAVSEGLMRNASVSADEHVIHFLEAYKKQQLSRDIQDAQNKLAQVLVQRQDALVTCVQSLRSYLSLTHSSSSSLVQQSIYTQWVHLLHRILHESSTGDLNRNSSNSGDGATKAPEGLKTIVEEAEALMQPTPRARTLVEVDNALAELVSSLQREEHLLHSFSSKSAAASRRQLQDQEESFLRGVGTDRLSISALELAIARSLLRVINSGDDDDDDEEERGKQGDRRAGVSTAGSRAGWRHDGKGEDAQRGRRGEAAGPTSSSKQIKKAMDGLGPVHFLLHLLAVARGRQFRSSAGAAQSEATEGQASALEAADAGCADDSDSVGAMPLRLEPQEEEALCRGHGQLGGGGGSSSSSSSTSGAADVDKQGSDQQGRRKLKHPDDAALRAQCQPLLLALRLFDAMQRLQGVMRAKVSALLGQVGNDHDGSMRAELGALLLHIGDLSSIDITVHHALEATSTGLTGARRGGRRASYDEAAVADAEQHLDLILARAEQAVASSGSDGDAADSEGPAQAQQGQHGRAAASRGSTCATALREIMAAGQAVSTALLELQVSVAGGPKVSHSDSGDSNIRGGEETRFAFAFAGVRPRVEPALASAEGAMALTRTAAKLLQLKALQRIVHICHTVSKTLWEPEQEEAVASKQAETISEAAQRMENAASELVCANVWRLFVRETLRSAAETFVGSRLWLLGLNPRDRSADLWMQRGPAPTLEGLLQETMEHCVANGVVRADRVWQHEQDVDALLALQRRTRASCQTASWLSTVRAQRKASASLLSTFRWFYAAELETIVTPQAGAGHARQQAPPPLPQQQQQQQRALAGSRLHPLRGAVDGLMQAASRLFELNQQVAEAAKAQRRLEGPVRDHLAWGASAGAQEAGGLLLNAFNSRVNGRQAAQERLQHHASLAARVANALAHFEMFRLRTPQRDEFEQRSLQLVRSFAAAVEGLCAVKAEAGRLERQLPFGIKDVAPRGQVKATWLEARTRELPTLLTQGMQEMVMQQQAVVPQQHALSVEVDPMHQAVEELCHLLGSLRPLLKPVAAGGGALAEQALNEHTAWKKGVWPLVAAASAMCNVPTRPLVQALEQQALRPFETIQQPPVTIASLLAKQVAALEDGASSGKKIRTGERAEKGHGLTGQGPTASDAFVPDAPLVVRLLKDETLTRVRHFAEASKRLCGILLSVQASAGTDVDDERSDGGEGGGRQRGGLLEAGPALVLEDDEEEEEATGTVGGGSDGRRRGDKDPGGPSRTSTAPEDKEGTAASVDAGERTSPGHQQQQQRQQHVSHTDASAATLLFRRGHGSTSAPSGDAGSAAQSNQVASGSMGDADGGAATHEAMSAGSAAGMPGGTGGAGSSGGGPAAMTGAGQRAGTPGRGDRESGPKGQRGRERQHRNANAVQMWQKVRAKLELRRSAVGTEDEKCMSVGEHVDWLIRAATSIENLATMYEGWASWV